MRRETRNRLRDQFGTDFEELQHPVGISTARPSLPKPGDVRLSTEFGAVVSGEHWDHVNERWINLKNEGVTAQYDGAVNIGIYDSAGNFTATDVEAALAELSEEIATMPVEESLKLDGSTPMTGDLDVGGNDLVNVDLVDGVDVSALPTVETTFTATGGYAVEHNRNTTPTVTVKNSSGDRIVVCVRYLTADLLVLLFDGTLTNAVVAIH